MSEENKGTISPDELETASNGVFNPFLGITFPMGDGEVKYLCDYCGGFTKFEKNRLCETVKCFELTSPRTGKSTAICSDCWVAAFDKVLRP